MHRHPIALLVLLSACATDEFGDGFRIDSDLRRETFVQVDPEPVDVLWVVDTSGSMADEQQALAEHFPQFAAFFEESGLSFHMGVTSTDVLEDDTEGSLDGRLMGHPGVLTDATEDLANAFAERALMGITPMHSDEKGLHAAYVAAGALAEPGQPNAGLVRDEANLAIVIISDEPDYSTIGEADSASFIGAEAFATWLDARKGDPARSSLSGVVGVPEEGSPGGCDLSEDAAHGGWSGALRGDGYLEAIAATEGMLQSICEDDWAEVLARMGLVIAGLHESFSLSDAVDPQTLVVRVDGHEVGDWEFLPEKNAVHFTRSDSIPRPGSEVRVSWRIPGEP
jgi:hypothetical protein